MMKSICILLGLLLLPAMVYYQKSIEISGRVFDAESHAPLKDSHIFIKNTNIGTVSSDYGEFSLSIPWKFMNSSLIASYVGYATFEKKLSEMPRENVKIAMEQDVVVLDEIVVTPENPVFVEKAIEMAMTNYDNRQEMLMDFYFALMDLDENYAVLKQVIDYDLLEEVPE